MIAAAADLGMKPIKTDIPLNVPQFSPHDTALPRRFHVENLLHPHFR